MPNRDEMQYQRQRRRLWLGHCAGHHRQHVCHRRNRLDQLSDRRRLAGSQEQRSGQLCDQTQPGLVYSTYLGGSGFDSGRAITVDSAGNAFVTGETGSTNFPTANALQTSPGGISDAFVVKLAGDGQTLIYSTYLGGSGFDTGRAIAVDASGSSYVAGQTLSANFPTANPQQASQASSGAYDAFIAQLSGSGSSLSYGSYLGGSADDYGESLALDATGAAYITGRTQSTNFPTVNPLQASSGGGTDVFVTAVHPNSGLLYSTYLGGNGVDQGWGIALDQAGNTYVTGQTSSSNFPTVTPQQGAMGGGSYDAFVVRLDALAPPPSSYNDEYTYDALGNLLSKTGLGAYTYGATVSGCAGGTPASKPHAAAQAGSITFSYDCNGNMLDGGGRIYT